MSTPVTAQCHHCSAQRTLQDLEAEKTAQAAAQTSQVQQDAARDKKRKRSKSEAHAKGKKQKMASVQALHTSHATQGQSSSVSQQSCPNASAGDTDSALQARQSSASPESDTDGDQSSRLDSSAADNVKTSQAKAAPQPDQKQKGEGLKQSVLDLKNDSLPALRAAAKHAQSDKQADSKLTDVKEYLVKWKGRSHMHCTWVRHEDVVKMGQRSTGLKSRLRHFLHSNTAAQVSSVFQGYVR